MIENTLWMTYFEYLPIELKQAEEEGKNVELYRKEIEEIIQTSGDMSFEEKERKAWEILDRIEKEPIKREFPYQEPNEIEKIEELRNTELRRNFTVDQATIEDRVWRRNRPVLPLQGSVRRQELQQLQGRNRRWRRRSRLR